MLNELRRVASALGTSVLSGPQYLRLGRISRPAISARFGTWREAVVAAGLAHPTVKGGIHKPCVVCGALFKGDWGRNSRKTCSDECRRKTGLLRSTYKGERASPQAARGRSRQQTDLRQCERCGVGGGRLEVHHKDRNPYNDEVSNLEVLCTKCHGREHRRVVPVPCKWCKSMFLPKSRVVQFCSTRCAGIAKRKDPAMTQHAAERLRGEAQRAKRRAVQS